jgi:4-aminobutyrate aminotransferase/(S)-3-amino-2-methylpropionate transaminase
MARNQKSAVVDTSDRTQKQYDHWVTSGFVSGIEPVVVDRARGAVIWSTDGSAYIDGFAGLAVTNVGHCHPRILSAVSSQMERLVHCGSLLYYVPVLGELAEQLASVAPSAQLQKTFFANSGAEAVEGAMRIAKIHTGKREFIALQGGFHGRTNATLGLTGNRSRKRRGGPYPYGIAFAPIPYEYRCRLCGGSCDLRCADSIKEVFEYQTSGDVAAFVAEPVLGEGGIIVPPRGYFERVNEIISELEMLFIVDEVQTGFGRTGRLFGIEHWGIQPDIMTMAKGIAAGFPMGAFIARTEIADSFQPGEHFSTFGGNPVCAAAALANLQVILEERLSERAATEGEWALDELRDQICGLDVVGDVRGLGLMIGVELVSDRKVKSPAPDKARRVRDVCRQAGVLVGVGGHFGNVIRIQPPLIIEHAQLQTIVRTVRDAISSLSR